MSDMPSMKDFLDFAETKPPEEHYVYGDPSICACNQFATHLGMRERYMRRMKITKDTEAFPFYPMETMAMLEPHTWGALVTRIKQLD